MRGVIAFAEESPLKSSSGEILLSNGKLCQNTCSRLGVQSAEDRGRLTARYWCLWTKLKINENKMKIEKGKREEEKKGKREHYQPAYNVHLALRQLPARSVMSCHAV